jgi:hypothetical protein
VTDNHPNEVVFHLTVEANLSTTGPLPQPWHPSLLSHRVTDRLAHSIHAFVGRLEHPPSEGDGVGLGYKALPTCLPSDLQILNLKSMRTIGESARKEPNTALLLHRRGFDCSYGQGDLLGVREKATKVVGADGQVSVVSIFDGLRMDRVKKSSLTLLFDEPVVTGAQTQRKEKRRLAETGGEEKEEKNGAEKRELTLREGALERSERRKLDEGGSQELALGALWNGEVKIEPMEIAAFKLDLVPRTI